MGDEAEVDQTLKEKLLFYTTAFFILLGTFSLFAFLFLVPFVIDPAFSTIFKQFDEVPASCTTMEIEHLHGAKNCSWASCREGCTKDIYECTRIYVNYKVNSNDTNKEANISTIVLNEQQPRAVAGMKSRRPSREFDYPGEDISLGAVPAPGVFEHGQQPLGEFDPFLGISDFDSMSMDMENESEWFFVRARLYPNVKGCGYPPFLNCSIWTKKYIKMGTNFSCYYSKVDPKLVITDLDMWQNTLNLVYAMAIPIPSFIISVIYLTIAYFKIYKVDEESEPLDKNAECMAEDDEEEEECDDIVDIVIPNGVTPLSASGPLTPNSDINPFGHQLKVKMADEMSRESLDAGVISNSGSLQGNLSKTMTTSISTPPGPTAAV